MASKIRKRLRGFLNKKVDFFCCVFLVSSHCFLCFALSYSFNRQRVSSLAFPWSAVFLLTPFTMLFPFAVI